MQRQFPPVKESDGFARKTLHGCDYLPLPTVVYLADDSNSTDIKRNITAVLRTFESARYTTGLTKPTLTNGKEVKTA